MTPVYVIVPFLDNWQQTERTLLSLGELEGCAGILAIDNGSSPETRARFEAYCRGHKEVRQWHHCPPLPSLAATWNAGLRFCWGSGAEAALVCNNDILLHPRTLETLLRGLAETGAYFISAVNAGGFPETLPEIDFADASQRGGPDFSCYLISREGHGRYPFDEAYVPGYCEDLDLHRRMLLAGDGDRIFSVNVPYEHLGGGSGTLKSMSPKQRADLNLRIEEGSRAYYARKWGGSVNAERFKEPFGESGEHAGVTTPELFDAVRKRWRGEQ